MKKETQLTLPIFNKKPRKRTPGAKLGRPRIDEHSGGAHKKREALAARFPVHVTLRRGDGLPSLRMPSTLRVLRRAFKAGCDRFGFRLVHYSVQSNHIHLLAEARDRRALSRGMQGLVIRMARALNRLWERSGKVFPHRYFDRILRTPREVHHVLDYILNNRYRHASVETVGWDDYASGPWFDGWRDGWRPPVAVECPLAEARTWLVRVGWRRHGLLRRGGDGKGKRGKSRP